MANDCLVTRLKGTVDNDNLKVFGSFTLKTTGDVSNSGEGYIRVVNDIGGRIKIIGGGAYTDEERTQGYASEFNITTDSFAIWLENGSHKVIITSVYNVTRVIFGVKLAINIEDLGYAKNGLLIGMYTDPDTVFYGNIDAVSNRESGSIVLQKLLNNSFLRFRNVSGNVANLDKFSIDYNYTQNTFGFILKNSDIEGDVSAFATFNNNLKEKLTNISTDASNVGKLYGNIEAFKDYVNMILFDVNYIPVTGNLATALGHMTKATLFAIGGHTDAEDLANLFDALHDNGKTDGSITCWMGTNKTLNGGAWTNGSTVTFTASGWSVA